MKHAIATKESGTPGRRKRQGGFAAAVLALALTATPALADHGGGHGGGGGGHAGGGFAHAGVGFSRGGGAWHGGVGGWRGGSWHGGWGGGWCCGWGVGLAWGWPWYAGFGYYYDPWLAYPYYGLAAWDVPDYNTMSEEEIRAQQNAMVEATSAPIDQPVAWNDGNATGAVTAIRDGHTPDGRACREFQQRVTIGGRSEQAYGTACQQADGSWQLVGQGSAP